MRLLLASLLVLACLAAPATAAPDHRGRPTVLLVLAHPDDETMIGGVLGRFRERGFRVVIAVATNGEGGKIVTRIPRNADLVEREPGHPEAGGTRTRVDLAARRQREHLAAGSRNGVERVYFLSRPDRPTFRDDYHGGVSSWDKAKLGATLEAIAGQMGPDVVITLNPDEGDAAHPQHTGIGALVRELHAGGGFDVAGRAPSLYGIREHDWLASSGSAQPDDVHFSRETHSPALGGTYGRFLRRAASEYRTQPVQPRAIAARARHGTVPGYRSTDLLRRLDRGTGTSLESLLDEHPPGRDLPALRTPRRGLARRIAARPP